MHGERMVLAPLVLLINCVANEPAIDLETRRPALKVPGLAAGITKGDELVWTGAAGLANIAEQRRVTTDTIFQWASVSKTVTGTALMMLYDEGKFALDDDVEPFLPFAVTNPHCTSKPITFRQLLTHVSSIIDNEDVYDDSYSATSGDSPIPLGTFLESYFVPTGKNYDADDNFDTDCPGTYYEYSNIAVGLAGHLVERISGKPFDQFVRERIFLPLGMTETSFHLANLDESNVAMPYEPAGHDFMAVGHSGYPTFPDGLLRTSVPHLARFLMMFANDGELDGVRILEAATAAEMRRIQFPALDETQGLIWFYADYGSHHVLGHDGEDDGTSSMMFFDPASKTGVLLVANGIWYDDVTEESLAADNLVADLLSEANGF
jgi:CubicO group peptidase (beta-lactamase class C family)